MAGACRIISISALHNLIKQQLVSPVDWREVAAAHCQAHSRLGEQGIYERDSQTRRRAVCLYGQYMPIADG